MKLGSIVKPKCDVLYLTPEDHNKAEDFDEWPSWFSDQVGIVLSSRDSDIVVMTPSGRGTCFIDEVVQVC